MVHLERVEGKNIVAGFDGGTITSDAGTLLLGRPTHEHDQETDLPPPRVRWLTRSEAAALLRAANAEPKARFHLCLFILIGIYAGARRDAILGLCWTRNTEGGWVDLDLGRIDFNPVGRTQAKKRRPVIPIPRHSRNPFIRRS